ncbi:MAG: serine/threonine protein kinase [Planctomycetes bacterium]|nr:serine/threonine protein kinase [Planctomycetota bacterium]
MRNVIWLMLAGVVVLDPQARIVSAQTKPRAAELAATDWPWWRGPSFDGIAVANPSPPLRWDDATNLIWKTPLVGRGHGSAIVVGEQVLLAVADVDHDQLSLLCLDRASGKPIWNTPVHSGKIDTKGNEKSSMASMTPACDGERVFVNFLFRGAVHTSAIDRQGKLLWQTKICDFVVHQGFASSPAVVGPLVLVSADNKAGGLLAGLDRGSGEIIWSRARPKLPNYTSPIPLSVAGKKQLLLTGCDLVTSLDPLTGQLLWETAGATTECVTSVVTDGRLVFTSGGYPKNHVSAIKADGSGELVWENNNRVYVPSMLVKDGYLYAVMDAGVAICLECATGKEVWKGRLGGTFSSSPVLVGDVIHATNEAGHTFLFRATSDSFQLVAENQLGSECFATPTICAGRIYTRVAYQEAAQGESGGRREYLICIGQPR